MKRVLVFFLVALAVACGSGTPDRVEDPALQSLYELVEENPTSAQAHRGLALALHGAGRREEALPHFEKAAELDPAPQVLLDLARSYVMLSRMQEAEAVYQRVLDDDPQQVGALYDLGNIALARGDAAGAIGYYGRVVEAQPDHLLALHNLGAALQQTDQLQDAYRTFEKVLEIDPTTPDELSAFDDALLRMASMDLRMGATQRAVDLIEVLLEAVPDHDSGHLIHAQALAKLGRQDEAEAAMDRHQRIHAGRTARSPQDAAPSEGG